MLLFLLACTNETVPTDTGPDPMLDGSVYELSIGGLTIDGADDGLNDLARLLFTSVVLMQVANADDAGFDGNVTFGTTTEPIERNPCSETFSIPDISLDGLSFSGGPRDITIEREVGTLNLMDMTVEGTFSDDGERIQDFVITGTGDLRIADGTALGPAANLCETFAGFGVPCAACPDNEPLCVSLTVRGLGATRSDIDFEGREPDPGECDPA